MSGLPPRRRPRQRYGSLILARRAGESILIGDHTRVEVLDMRRSQVRLRITAPVDVQIEREEIADCDR